jgi:hypothetical protein
MRAIFVGTVLLAAGCRQDGGLAPEAEVEASRGVTAQCLGPASGAAATSPGYVRSRLAAVLARPGEVVCLSEVGGRWQLRGVRP